MHLFKVKMHSSLNFKNLTLFVFFIAVISLTLAPPSFAENEDRTRLETSLVDPVTGVDHGHARFEERPDRKLLTVEIEDQKPNVTFHILIDTVVVDPITTDSFGFAAIDLDSRKGDDVPSVKTGSKIEITSSDSLVLLGIFGGGTTANTPSSPTTPPISTTSVTIPLGAKDKTVTEFFSPRVIQVNQFDTVTWTNKDNTAHTVTGSTFDSGLISPGGTFSHKFSENGTFDYACQLHPWMTGQVVVGKGGTTSVPLPIPPTPSPTPSPFAPVPSQAKISIPLGAADKKVTEYFVPKSLTVKADEMVTWKNDDLAVHTVTSGSGPKDGLFDSGLLGSGKSFSFTFTTDGMFDYFCQVHPWMTGQVIVSGSSTQSQTNPPSGSLPSPPVIPATQNTLLKKSTILKVSIPSGAANKEVTEYFVPKTITIKTLDSILWTNQDLASHTVTSGLAEKGGDGMFDSGLIPAGKSFQFEFKKAGTVDYFCMVHPWMTGQVIVKEDAATKGTVIAPLKQIKSGVSPKDVECRSNLELVLKARDGSPACVKSDTKVKLVNRGWASS